MVHSVRYPSRAELLRWLCIPIAIAALAGCHTVAGNIALGVSGVTTAGTVTPDGGIEQVYYLGTFDPLEQLPQSFYRVTVRGQSSFISNVKFASGWVPSAIVDSLSTDVSAGVKQGAGQTQTTALDDSIKRMFMLGPEGIRVSPANQRLVIVMGASPDAFFAAVDETLGGAAVAAQHAGSDAAATVAQNRLQQERLDIKDFRLRVAQDELRVRAATDARSK